MATITQNQWNRYISRLRKINDTAAEEFRNLVIDKGGYGNIERQKLIDYAYGISTKYGEASAALSAEMYDALAELSGATVPAAVPAEISYQDVAKTVNGIIKKTGNEEILAQGIGRLVKMAGTDTILSNAYRDRPKGKGSKRRHSGAQVAWIPYGDTCPFCLMLASKGWVNQTEWGAKNHSEHIHANCDCTYAVRFNNDLNFEGYDPGEYKAIYDNAEGKTRNQKFNSMRRDYYAENRDKINAQKRAAYAARKEPQYLRNNLPKDFIDTRSIGTPISKDELANIVKFANDNGIQMGRDGSRVEFDTYCGDPAILREIVEETASTKRELGIEKIILEYDNVLGYENDPSMVDIGAFAQTKGNTIRINKFMFDDSEFLALQYNEAVESKFFAQGTSYVNVTDHEMGHIASKKDRKTYKNAIKKLQRDADDANMELAAYIQDNISLYAGTESKDGTFNELIPELVSMAHGSSSEYALSVLGRR